MNSKVIKKTLSVALSVLLVFSFVFSVSAQSLDTYFYTHSTTTDTNKTEPTHSMTCNKTKVTGEDVGFYFYNGNAGFPSGIYPVTNRIVTIMCREDDDLYSTLARTYRGYCSSGTDGLYKVRTISQWYVNTSSIEGESDVEIFMRFNVESNPHDTSSSVPSRILQYRIWVD